MNKLPNFILLFACAALIVSGQALWKISTNQVAGISGILNILVKLITNLPFVLGSIFYVFATFLWIYLLGQNEYSRIYPVFVGTCIIISIVIGVVFFKENTGVYYKILGSILIVCGIIIISRN